MRLSVRIRLWSVRGLNQTMFWRRWKKMRRYIAIMTLMKGDGILMLSSRLPELEVMARCSSGSSCDRWSPRPAVGADALMS